VSCLRAGEIPGCTDETACNYNQAATMDNGQCVAANECGSCEGDLSCLGCTEGGDTEAGTVAACNYDSAATIDDGSCYYPNACDDCPDFSGSPDALIIDEDGNEVANPDYNENYGSADTSCLGCIDEASCNFNADATVDDGSCTYAASGYNCEGTFTCAFAATPEEMTFVTYVDAAGQSWGYENSWTVADADGNILWEAAAGGGFIDDVSTAPSVSLCMDPEACYTFTLFDSYGDGWNGNSLDAGEFGVFTMQGGNFIELTNCVVECTDTEVPVSWLVGSDGYGFSIYNDEDGVVATGGSDFDGVACLDLASCYNIDLVPPAGDGGGIDGSVAALVVDGDVYAYVEGSNGVYSSIFTNVLGTGCPVFGCTDESADNYDPAATDDDGSCEFSGCTDSTACNYDENANVDDASCTFANECGSCDADLSCFGCTDSTASNFSADATIDDGSCEFAGCTDTTACNFDADADVDDGSCTYTDGIYDCNGTTCLADADGDGICDPLEVGGCTDSAATNYDADATDNDGSCNYAVFGCTDATAGNFNTDATDDDGSCDYGPWNVPGSDCNMTILLSGDLDLTVEGESVTAPIWVGVGSGDEIYGSALYTPGVTTSIAAWGAEGDTPGFVAGDELEFVVWVDGEAMSASATFATGAQTWSCNGLLPGMTNLDATAVVTQAIPLGTGWNIWSTYVAPEDGSMESVFSAIVDDVIICKDENGLVFWPAFNLNSIGSLIDGEGYQIKVATGVTLEVTGALIDNTMSIELPSGWSIVGYVQQEPVNAEAAMSPVVENLIIMKDENGLVFWPSFNLNSIGDMQAGEGYQVKMGATESFSYASAGSGRFGYAEPIRTVHYDKAKNTGSNMTIGLPTTAWEMMPAIGDEIAAYDESGKMIGSSVFNGDNVALTVWGDDVTTTAKDVLALGEAITLKLWSSNMNTESTLVVTKWDAGSDVYTVDGISIASDITLSATSAEACKLYQNEPNPFNGTTTIKFYVPTEGEVSIGVYNMLGEYVGEVTNEFFTAGKHSVTFNANDLGQGTYFVRMTTEGFTETKNMNIVK
jgi:hypothetical protein